MRITLRALRVIGRILSKWLYCMIQVALGVDTTKLPKTGDTNCIRETSVEYVDSIVMNAIICAYEVLLAMDERMTVNFT